MSHYDIPFRPIQPTRSTAFYCAARESIWVDAATEAVNFAYEQGLRDGTRPSSQGSDRLWLVTGDTPDRMEIRVEGRWERLKRRFRMRA